MAYFRNEMLDAISSLHNNIKCDHDCTNCAFKYEYKHEDFNCPIALFEQATKDLEKKDREIRDRDLEISELVKESFCLLDKNAAFAGDYEDMIVRNNKIKNIIIELQKEIFTEEL